MKTILGKKMGMTQIFDEEGNVIPVTVIEAGPEVVTQVKTVETDGYNAVQVGFEDQKPQRVNKPLTGHFEKAGVTPKKHLAEFRIEEGESYEVGQVITVADFEVGKKLDITGTSKGKGTQGNIKRHGHHRGPMSHGSKHKRLAGALAAGTYPSRVFKGNAGPGRMGRDTVTVQNVVLVKVIEERNLMLVKGAVPGNKGGLVRVQYAVKGQDKVTMLNMAGAEAGTIELNDAIFGITPNENAVHAVVKNYLANQRQGTQSAKTRGEVRGGGRKPFRQKGTGRHRQGSSTDPSQIGGGVVFAPKPRDYRYTLPKKLRRLAMKSALSSKVLEKEIIVLDELKLRLVKKL